MVPRFFELLTGRWPPSMPIIDRWIEIWPVEAARPAPQQIDRTKRIVERVWEAIENQIFYPTPSAMQCPSCAYRAECRAWQG